MSIKVDLKKTSRQILVELIGKCNGLQLSPGSLLFGTPVALDESEVPGRNTKVSISADARNIQLQEGSEFFYSRMPFDEIVMDADLQMPPYGRVRNLTDALRSVSDTLGIHLTTDDFLPQTLPGHGNEVPFRLPLTISPNSLAYTGGTFDVGWALFDQLISSAGVKSCRYDLRRPNATFQDAVGTTPVTGSGQPLGRLVDLFGKGNHATQSTITARPEYWIDPATNEPVTWYDFADDKLLWPGVAGTNGTVGIAFSTGAQVFDLVAPAHIPPGPMIELMFFDRTLTDIEAAVLRCYLDMQVKDDSWLGYVRGTNIDFYVQDSEHWKSETPPTAAEYEEEFSRVGLYSTFSVDGRVYYPEVTDYNDVYVYRAHVLSVPRQRFKIGAKDYSFRFQVTYDAWNGGQTWTPDVYPKLLQMFPRASVDSYHIPFGTLDLLRRGEVWKAPARILKPVQHNSTFRYYGKPLPNNYTLPKSVESIYCYSTFELFSSIRPDFSKVTDVMKALVYLNTTNPVKPNFSDIDFTKFSKLTDLQFHGVDFGGTLPILPPNIFSTVYLDSCNITGPIPPNYFDKVKGPYVWVSMAGNQLSGIIPNIARGQSRILSSVYLNNNQLTGYAGGGVKIASNGYNYRYYSNNLLTQAAVDLLISDFLAAAQAASNTAGTRLYLHGTGNAAPSAQGKANAVALRALGWNVQHNN